MGSEMQPQIMRAQKSEQILLSKINKDSWHILKYQSTLFNHLGLLMFIGSSIADTEHIFLVSLFSRANFFQSCFYFFSVVHMILTKENL
jgi:hypothetical protein